MAVKRPKEVPEELFRGEIIPDLIFKGMKLVSKDKQDELYLLATNPYPSYARIDLELALEIMRLKSIDLYGRENLGQAVDRAIMDVLRNDLVREHEEIAGMLAMAESNLTNLGEKELAKDLHEYRTSKFVVKNLEIIKNDIQRLKKEKLL